MSKIQDGYRSQALRLSDGLTREVQEYQVSRDARGRVTTRWVTIATIRHDGTAWRLLRADGTLGNVPWSDRKAFECVIVNSRRQHVARRKG